MFLDILLTIILVFVLGFGGMEGLWSNAIRLVNVLIAALLAVSFWPLLADFIEGLLPSATFHVDMVALGLLFGISMLIMRMCTDQLSRTKVRFLPLVDKIGGYALAALSGLVLLGFITMVLHTAPASNSFLGDSFKPGEQPGTFYGTGIDRKWLAFVHMVSAGSLSSMQPPNDPDAYVFDPNSTFVSDYYARRTQYEKVDTFFADKYEPPKK